MLQIHTFDARSGGNVLYKALSHPLVAEAIGRLYNRMRGPVALYDPDTVADALIAFDDGRIAARIRHLVPPGAAVISLHDARLPDTLLSVPSRYLDKLNFATNF